MSLSSRALGVALLTGAALGCVSATPPALPPGEASAPADATPTAANAEGAPAPEPLMKPAITEVTEGLLPAHADARPLLDRVEYRGRGGEQVRRTYPDGAQYLLTQERGAAGQWSPFVPITEAGVAKIEQIVADELVAKTPPPPPPAGPSGGQGSIVWVAYVADGVKVVQTASGSYAALPPFVKMLDEAVSQNVKRAE